MFVKFLHRPVLGIVLSILTVFVGLLSIKTLPIAQFPEIAPPRVVVLLSFPGASAEVLVKSSITILEQAINGVQGMRYITSSSTSSGDAIIQVYFEPGTNSNDALVQVKTRVDQMMYRLPELVRLEGILVQPVQASNLLYVNLYSTDKNATEKFLFNYATVYLIPELKRIKGVGQAKILGARQFAMRVWLDPDRMRAYNITTSEVMKSIQAVAWEGLTYDEALRGNEAFYIFLVVLVFVYLVLSAQYESFIIPFTVIFSLPPGLFGSFFLLKLLGLANDVYAQIGLIMLVGLLGKNAVLIVEFARQKQAIVGLTVFEAAIEGAKARFRPILMTSFAFIAGLIPLLVSGGPVAVANRTIGACALGGMLFGTIFGVILVPGLYYIFGSLAEGKELYKQQEELPLSEDHIRDTNLMKHHEGEIHE